MNTTSDYIIGFIAFFLLYKLYKYQQRQRQIAYIQNYTFPKKVRESLLEKYPYLKENEIDTVINALKDFFIFSNQANLKSLSMPSQVVDVAWHEFILFTQLYAKFCTKAFGKFYHHVPAEAMESKTTAQKGIKRIWRLACKHENISAKKPNQLPRLFAIDTLLKIEDGFKYSLDCKHKTFNTLNAFCASDIGGSCSGSSCSSCGGDSSCGGGCGGD